MRRLQAAKLYRSYYRNADVKGLTEVMQNGPYRWRLGAVGALTRIGTPEAERALLLALSDRRSFVRTVAVNGLADINPDRDPEPVLRALPNGPVSDELTPEQVIDAGLHRLRALDTVPILRRGLGSDDDTVRLMAAKFLGELADPRSAPALTRALDDSHRGVRSAAREGLNRIKR